MVENHYYLMLSRFLVTLANVTIPKFNLKRAHHKPYAFQHHPRDIPPNVLWGYKEYAIWLLRKCPSGKKLETLSDGTPNLVGSSKCMGRKVYVLRSSMVYFNCFDYDIWQGRICWLKWHFLNVWHTDTDDISASKPCKKSLRVNYSHRALPINEHLFICLSICLYQKLLIKSYVNSYFVSSVKWFYINHSQNMKIIMRQGWLWYVTNHSIL